MLISLVDGIPLQIPMLSSQIAQAVQPKIIRIHHECEGRIAKSLPRIAVWNHEACRVMTNGDPEGRIFLSFPHTNNGFFFLLTTFFFIYLFQNKHS